MKVRNDSDYYFIFQEIIQPMLDEFQPDIVFVSAGFTCGGGDK